MKGGTKKDLTGKRKLNYIMIIPNIWKRQKEVQKDANRPGKVGSYSPGERKQAAQVAERMVRDEMVHNSPMGEWASSKPWSLQGTPGSQKS